MADLLPSFELELRIALLPSISRGAHLGGPLLRAQQLVGLWQVTNGDDVPLAQAFRLLDEATIARAILRSLCMPDADHSHADPRRWWFPPFEVLLPKLQEMSWQAVLDGALMVEGIKGVRGNRYRVVLPAELPRLTPDWGLSRLVRGGSDEFIDVRVGRQPAQPIKKAWRKKKLSRGDLKNAILDIAKGYPVDAHPSERDIWVALKGRLGNSVTREQARSALNDYAPQLRGQRGRRWPKSPD